MGAELREKPSYKDTLNLPKTDFPMKANLPKLEPNIQEKWKETRLDDLLSQAKSGQPVFILHDGPPYANGDIHLGHTLNKVLKDIIVRSKNMAGFYSPYVPGWDCHGQPIEHEVQKRLGSKKSEVDKTEIRKLCRDYALKFVDRQREQFQRLGVAGIWRQPYLTLDNSYEATNVKVFKELYQKGLVYKGRKPIHWCYVCRTALAEAEIEYQDDPSPSIYVKFPFEGSLKELESFKETKSLLVWTTTPWTLPANVAVAVNPKAEYVAVRDGGEILVLAQARVASLSETLGRELEVVATFNGGTLEGQSYSHPTKEETAIVVTADFVELDQGTGAVHIAPGHGEDDYKIGLKNKLPSPMPVNESGVFTEDAGKYAGQHIKKANDVIIEDLKDSGRLIKSETIEHSYPHCWRCKSPVIFRATEQWFISMDAHDLRKRALEIIGSVEWVPGWSIRRISGMVEERPDWCISRQRAWGVPIPVFYCDECSELLATTEVFEHIEEIFEREGADTWFEKDAGALLPEGTVCAKCGSRSFRKEEDILDVWFESGVSHMAVLELRPELSWPADLYLEGSDQHRGWFQSSLLTSVGLRSKAPYRQVLTHGFLVDGNGRKMSKSLGNVVNPLKVIEKSGADILRLWVCSADYSSDIAVSDEILQRISEAYRRIRNTIRFMLGSLSDFDPINDKVLYADMEPIDKWALMKLHELIKKVDGAYEDYRLHLVFHSIYNFCVVDLSSFYLDVLKDSLYTLATDSRERRSAQTAIYEITASLIKIIAPVLVFTAEEAWAHLPGREETVASVHLELTPEVNEDYINLETKDEWEKILLIRSEVAKATEEARSAKIIGSSLEARIILSVPEEIANIVEAFKDMLPSLFIVSQVETVLSNASSKGAWQSKAMPGLTIEVDRAQGKKCARCWNFRHDVGADAEHTQLCGRCLEVIRA